MHKTIWTNVFIRDRPYFSDFIRLVKKLELKKFGGEAISQLDLQKYRGGNRAQNRYFTMQFNQHVLLLSIAQTEYESATRRDFMLPLG